jgi:HAD superfamily hydrolase (TIGR01549 family)
MYEGIRALTFDFGNTLFDYYSVIYEVFRRTMSRINGKNNHSKEEFLESFFRAHSLIPEYLKENELKYTQHDKEYWIAFYQMVFERLEINHEEAGKFFNEEWSNHPQAEIYPEATEVLKTLKERGYKIGIITNTINDYPLIRLKETGLMEYIDVVVQSFEFGISKPSAEIFEHTCKELGQEKSLTVHIGDEYYQDIKGGREAGLYDAILYLPFEEIPEPLVKNLPASEKPIKNLKELLELFQQK